MSQQDSTMPVSDMPKPQPGSPGHRPSVTPQRHELDRTIAPSLASRVARFFGFQTYTADVAERVVGVVVLADLSRASDSDDTITGAEYKVFTIDLSTARDRRVIEGTQDMMVSAISISSLSAGALAQVHIGDRDGWDIGGAGLGPGSSWEIQPPEQTRILITNTAQAGLTLKLILANGIRVTP